jgi:hypothetical protein
MGSLSSVALSVYGGFMKFEVWHAHPPNFFGDVARAASFPRGYLMVAEVETADLDAVFRLTNHIGTSWTENAEVTVISTVTGPRSTSVGDIIVGPFPPLMGTSIPHEADVLMIADVGHFDMRLRQPHARNSYV